MSLNRQGCFEEDAMPTTVISNMDTAFRPNVICGMEKSLKLNIDYQAL